MYSKEDILFAALKVNPSRIASYCQPVDEPILEEIRKLPSWSQHGYAERPLVPRAGRK